MVNGWECVIAHKCTEAVGEGISEADFARQFVGQEPIQVGRHTVVARHGRLRSTPIGPQYERGPVALKIQGDDAYGSYVPLAESLAFAPLLQPSQEERGHDATENGQPAAEQGGLQRRLVHAITVVAEPVSGTLCALVYALVGRTYRCLAILTAARTGSYSAFRRLSRRVQGSFSHQTRVDYYMNYYTRLSA